MKPRNPLIFIAILCACGCASEQGKRTQMAERVVARHNALIDSDPSNDPRPSSQSEAELWKIEALKIQRLISQGKVDQYRIAMPLPLIR